MQYPHLGTLSIMPWVGRGCFLLSNVMKVLHKPWNYTMNMHYLYLSIELMATKSQISHHTI
jgi:hypothetical protein